MSILNTFDRYGEEIIKASNNVRKIENFPTTVMVVFSTGSTRMFLSKYRVEKIGALYAGGYQCTQLRGVCGADCGGIVVGAPCRKMRNPCKNRLI